MPRTLLLRTISRVAGSEIVDDAVAFFRAFEGMEDGFRQRARRVEQLLADPGTAFVLVAAPREDSIEEARFFARRLEESSIEVSALVANRLLPNFGPGGEAATSYPGPWPGGRSPLSAGEGPVAYAELRGNLDDFLSVSSREERYVTDLAVEVAPAPVVRVPFLEEDVHDLEGLEIVARHLLAGK